MSNSEYPLEPISNSRDKGRLELVKKTIDVKAEIEAAVKSKITVFKEINPRITQAFIEEFFERVKEGSL